MIQVNKPFLPPQEEYARYLDGIWQRNWLTNNGPLVDELELKLRQYLSVPHLLFMANGTIALQIALRAMGVKGRVITTPFTYIATASSMVWEGCTPVFVDIDPRTLNIDPKAIEQAIEPDTAGIVATHVFGNPADIDAITRLASGRKIPVIFDAAHCFGSTYRGKSVFAFGDVSTASFHATKLFHTVEGGAVFTSSESMLERMGFMRNFGHHGPTEYREIGINGKNSEFHAAMGLANLVHVPEILRSRREQCQRYDALLEQVASQKQERLPESDVNHAYYPLILENESLTVKVMAELQNNKIYPRRYFYPSLNTVPLFQGPELRVSESISKRILCLPLYHTLSNEEIDFISRIILKALTTTR